ncbi:MAG: c-type cytochrome [Chloroflexi bacterium]|nr:c-type cytochrome [Chloroflexota bacterium]
MRRLLFLIAVLSLGATACTGLGGEPAVVATLPPPATLVLTAPPNTDRGIPASPPDLARGAQIFAERCSACHGVDGRGDGPVVQANPGMQPGDFRDPATARGQTPHEWFSTITNGRIDLMMPPWIGALTEQERWDVALYTYTMHYDPEALWLGSRMYEDCAECHGELGRGDGPEAANLTADVKDLTDQSAMVTLSDESIFRMVTQGFEDVMPAYTELSEDERWAVASYARTLSLQGVEQFETQPAPVDFTDSLTDLTGVAFLVQIHAIGDALQVTQALQMRNLSETRTFSQQTVLDDGTIAALALTLPDGAILDSTAGIGAVSADGRTAYVTEPLAPRSDGLAVLSYLLPYEPGASLSIPLDIVIAGPVRVLTRPLTVRVDGDLLPSLGEQTVGSELYNGYGDQLALAAGSTLEFAITGEADPAPVEALATSEPAPESAEPAGIPASTLAPLIVIAVAVGVVGGAVIVLRRRPAERDSSDIDALVAQIAALDLAHDRGQLNHDLWHRQRAELKARLAELMGQDES